jgi:hypothetical protein
LWKTEEGCADDLGTTTTVRGPHRGASAHRRQTGVLTRGSGKAPNSVRHAAMVCGRFLRREGRAPGRWR